MRTVLVAAALALMALMSGCPHGEVPRPSGPSPTVDQVVERLTKARDELHSFTGAAVMDYWLGSNRFKGEVLVMGETGSKVRVAALSPAGGSTIAEMACDGHQFVSVDYQNNCTLTGPCSRQSIATFFGIELAPDDFLHLALGTPPVVAEPHGAVTWDGSAGVYRVALEGKDGKQTIGIAERDQRWDVVDSALVGNDGVGLWSVKNASFDNAKDPAGADHRVPGKSHFVTPAHEKADLTVEWRERTVNVTIDPAKFTIAVPPGTPTCGAKK
jgi:outer membrane lipoprotein-sorting protein